MGNPTAHLAVTTSSPVGLLFSICAVIYIATSMKNLFEFHTSVGQPVVVYHNSMTSEHQPTRQQVFSDSTFCTYDMRVLNWEGKGIPVCNTTVCAGRDSLMTLPAPAAAAPVHRWTPSAQADYILSYKNHSIEGWMVLHHMSYVKALTKLQHFLGIYGSVGEIGVHHGKFFMVLAGNALKTEPVVAMDLFYDQKSNVDGSGAGNMDALLSHTSRLGLPRDTLHIWAANSMSLTAGSLSAKGLPKWRMLSVDGGHSYEVTLHDLMLASCTVADGGIVILDDVTNPTWMGVNEALAHFIYAQQRLVPFMHGDNKMYFTTTSHSKQYYDFVMSRPLFNCKILHNSRRTLGGHLLCFTGDMN